MVPSVAVVKFMAKVPANPETTGGPVVVAVVFDVTVGGKKYKKYEIALNVLL